MVLRGVMEITLNFALSSSSVECMTNCLKDKWRKKAKNYDCACVEPRFTQDLNSFVNTFNKSIALLNSLQTPDLGSFILFSWRFEIYR